MRKKHNFHFFILNFHRFTKTFGRFLSVSRCYRIREIIFKMKRKNFSLFDNLIEGIQVLSKDLKYVYVNDALIKQLRAKKKYLVGFYIVDVFPDYKNSKIHLALLKCLKQQEVVHVIEHYQLPDGKKIWFDIKIQPYEDGLFVMTTDITKQKEAEALAEQKEQSYRQLFDKLSEGFIIRRAVKDEAGKVVDLVFVTLNDNAAEVIGLPRDEIIGKLRSEILGTLGGRSLEVANEVLLEGKTIRYENKYNRLNRWVLITSYSPEPDIMASFVVDITPLKNYEQELKRLNEQLESSVYERTVELSEALAREKKINDLKSSFISMTSHELNTPLASIKLCVEVLEKLNTKTNKSARSEYHSYIKDEVKNLIAMLNSFIYPMFPENRMLISLENGFDLATFFQSMVKELSEMCKEGQKIIYQHHGQKLVYLDKGILRRIVLNLLSNAIKYSKKDILIQTNVMSESISLEIIDQGIGIPKKEQAKMFKQFFRASNVGNIQGTGLGLNIVKTYVELMDGTISFDSEKNKGTTFKIFFPIEAI